MKGLKIILWILAIGFMTGFIFMLIPWCAIDKIYLIAGEQPMPNTPLPNYSIRVTCGMVGMIGIYFLILALNPLKYRTLVFFSSYALIAIGLLCIIIGLITCISPVILLGDALFGLVFGIILLLLSFRTLKGKE